MNGHFTMIILGKLSLAALSVPQDTFSDVNSINYSPKLLPIHPNAYNSFVWPQTPPILDDDYYAISNAWDTLKKFGLRQMVEEVELQNNQGKDT